MELTKEQKINWVNGFKALPAKDGRYYVMTNLKTSNTYDIRTLPYTAQYGWNTTVQNSESPITYDEEDYDEMWWAPVEETYVLDQ